MRIFDLMIRDVAIVLMGMMVLGSAEGSLTVNSTPTSTPDESMDMPSYNKLQARNRHSDSVSH